MDDGSTSLIKKFVNYFSKGFKLLNFIVVFGVFILNFYFIFGLLEALIGVAIGIGLAYFWWSNNNPSIKKGEIDFTPSVPVRENESGTFVIVSESDQFFTSKRFFSLTIQLVISSVMIGAPLFLLSGLAEVEVESLSHLLLMLFSPYILFIVGWIGLIVLGGYWLYTLVKKLLVFIRMKPGQLTVHSWPLKLGETVEATYSRAYSEELTIKSIKPWLACTSRLEVPSSGKSNSKTQTKTIQSVSLPRIQPNEENPGELNEKLTFTIPNDGLPSFDRPDHKYEWTLKLEFDIESFPDDTSTIKLFVIPEVASGGN